MAAFVCAAQSEDYFFGVPEKRAVGKQEPQPADESTGALLPYSQIIRDDQPPYEDVLRDLKLGGNLQEKAGPVDVFLKARLFQGARFNVPLAARGGPPEDPELRIGIFYLDLRALTVGVLHSDNVNLSETARTEGTIAMMRLSTVAYLQVTDNTRLGVRGSLVYLPIRGKFGVAGFGIDDPLVQFEGEPLLESRMNSELRLGEWELQLFDDFIVRHRRFGALGIDFFNGETFLEEDRAGRYTYHYFFEQPVGGNGGANGGSALTQNQNIGFTEFRNLVGGSIGRTLPTDTWFQVGGYHANYFYIDGADALPDSRDTVFALASSERETLRFKPFGRIQATRVTFGNGRETGWQEEARAGLRGPITENISFYGDVGYHHNTDSQFSTLVAHVRVKHQINPLTFHEIVASRGVTEPEYSLRNSVAYHVHHIFRDDLIGDLYGSIARYEFLPGAATTTGLDGEERRAAVRIKYDFGKHTSLRLLGVYYDFNSFSPTGEDYREWIGRSELYYHLSETVTSRLIYQYRQRDSDTAARSYFENLLVWTVTKYF